MSPIIDLQRRMVEVGRIRMGAKEGNRPVKLEFWRFTSRDKTRLEECAALFGGTVRPWKEREGEYELLTNATELPIMLLPGQTLSQWYELWSAGGCQRRCDGITDVIADGPCVCDTEEGERKCKPTTRLSVMLPDVPGLGCWRLETHGYYAAVELAGTASMLEQATARGQLFPARLRMDQRRQVKNGQTMWYSVPVIDIDVRSRDLLLPALESPKTFTPIPAVTGNGVTVSEALEQVNAEAKPRARGGRQTAPIGPVAEFDGPTQPLPVDEPEMPAEPVSDYLSAAQKKKLNVLVGQLRDAGHITTEQLWAAMARQRSIDADTMLELLAGRDEHGVCHWTPLRDSLTVDEASGLIERLGKLAANVEAVA